MQIVVLGVHRSGTSALTRLINMMGVYVGTEGSTVSFHIENQKGYWERHDVMALNNDLLEHYDCRWDDLLYWNARLKTELTLELNDRIKHLLLQMDHHRPWVIKDPRMCQTFALWRRNMEIPLAVIVWRNPIDVAKSLHTRGIPLVHGLAIWEHCTRCIIESVQTIPHLYVSHEDILSHPVDVTQRVYDWFCNQQVGGIRMPASHEIEAFIDPSLHHARSAAQEAVSSLLNDEMRQLLAYLQAPSEAFNVPPLSLQSEQAFEMYHATRTISDEHQLTRAFGDRQADRIRELEAIVESYQSSLAWQLPREEWESLQQRLGAFENETRGAIEHLKYSGLLGRIRLMVRKFSGNR